MIKIAQAICLSTILFVGAPLPALAADIMDGYSMRAKHLEHRLWYNFACYFKTAEADEEMQDYFIDGVTYLFLNKKAEARVKFEHMQEKNSSSPALAVGWLLYHYQARDREKASKAIKKAMEVISAMDYEVNQLPLSSYLHFFNAQILTDQLQFREAWVELLHGWHLLPASLQRDVQHVDAYQLLMGSIMLQLVDNGIEIEIR